MTVPIPPVLLATTLTAEFSAEQESEMLEFLASLDERTYRQPLDGPEDLFLDDNGRTRQGGFRLTRWALAKISDYVSSGLKTLVADIGGDSRRAGEIDEMISVATASRIINACVALRFRRIDGLLGRHLVCDPERGTVDGIVGRGYRLLPHARFHDMLSSVVAGAPTPGVFHSARLVGRRMAWLFLCPHTRITAADGEHYQLGYYFVNAEAGEAAVRASMALCQIRTGFKCLGQARGRQSGLAHSGKRFEKHLGGVLARVLVDEDQLATLAKQLLRLGEQPLRLLTEDNKLNKERAAIIAFRLRRRDVPAQLAKEVVRRAIYSGAAGETIPAVVQIAHIAQRTTYDVFGQLLHVAAAQPVSMAEKLERLAYQVLIQKIVF